MQSEKAGYINDHSLNVRINGRGLKKKMKVTTINVADVFATRETLSVGQALQYPVC